MATVKQVREWLAAQPDDYVVEFQEPECGYWLDVDAVVELNQRRQDGTTYDFISPSLRAVPPSSPRDENIPGSGFVHSACPDPPPNALPLNAEET